MAITARQQAAIDAAKEANESRVSPQCVGRSTASGWVTGTEGLDVVVLIDGDITDVAEGTPDPPAGEDEYPPVTDPDQPNTT